MAQLALVTIIAGTLAAAPLAAAQAEALGDYSGEQLYKRFCASCHGERAQGDGPVAAFFKLAPPDLTRIAQRHGGTFPAEKVRRIIDGREPIGPHGARQMPVWGMELYFADPDNPKAEKQSDELIGRLVEYLRTLQRK